MKNFRNITQVRQPRESNGLVIHVSSLNDRSTEVVMSEIVRIGDGEECDVKIRMPQATPAPANGVALEITRVNGTYRITSRLIGGRDSVILSVADVAVVIAR